MITKPNVSIWLDNRRKKKDNKFPVKIRLTYQRQRYYYPKNFELTDQELQQAVSLKPGSKLKDTHIKLYEFERKANEAIDKIADELHSSFSIGLFERQLGINSSNNDDVFKCFEQKA